MRPFYVFFWPLPWLQDALRPVAVIKLRVEMTRFLITMITTLMGKYQGVNTTVHSTRWIKTEMVIWTVTSLEADLEAAEAVTEDSHKLVTGSSDMTGHAASTPQPSTRPEKKAIFDSM